MDQTNTEFASVEAAVAHYQQACSALQRQVDAANQDMDDYTESTKELQLELESELDRMDKSEREMRRALEGAENEKDEWKGKYTTSLREHTATMSHMQRELESLRNSENALRTKLRDMELDNDDLEKSEREKDSSLQDLENRYGKSIERIALLEEELVTKAQLEEEVQRLKDELRDLHEEVAVLKTQLGAAYSVPPSRSTTPPRAAQSATSDALSASPPSSASAQDSAFDTPRQRGSPVSTASSTPPSFPVVKATPAREGLASPSPVPSRASSSTSNPAAARLRTMSTHKPFTPPPSIPKSPSTFGSRLSQTPAQLARSTRGVNLASQTATGMTPKAVRERRADGMIRDMKEMTDRVKTLTARLDSRRNLVMAGSSIPRQSMSPGGAGLQRSMTARRIAGLTPSNLSFASGHARKDSKGLSAREEDGAMRPPSRTALRQSIGGSRQSTIPVRPQSRTGNHSSLSVSSSRPATPSLPSSRSPTPSAASTGSAKPPWGAPAGAGSRASLSASTNRPRAGSAALSSSTYGGVGRGVPSGRVTPDLSSSVSRVPRPASREGHHSSLGRTNPPPMPSPATQAAALRRTSLSIPVRPGSALGRSVRRPSGTGGAV